MRILNFNTTSVLFCPSALVLVQQRKNIRLKCIQGKLTICKEPRAHALAQLNLHKMFSHADSCSRGGKHTGRAAPGTAERIERV